MELNRMKLWRLRKRKLEDFRQQQQCSCVYHVAAQHEEDENSSSCECDIHLQAAMENEIYVDCECDIHLQAVMEKNMDTDCKCDIHLQAAIDTSDHLVPFASPTQSSIADEGKVSNADSSHDSDTSRHHWNKESSAEVFVLEQGPDRCSEKDVDSIFSSENNYAGSVLDSDNSTKESSTEMFSLQQGPDSGSEKDVDSIVSSESNYAGSALDSDNSSKESSTQRIFLEQDPDSGSEDVDDVDSDVSNDEENVQQPPNAEVPHHRGGDSSDDPDDPDDSGDSENSDQYERENNNNASDSDPDADLNPGTRILTFENDVLNTPLQMDAELTTREAVAMVLSLADKNNLNYEMIIKILMILHSILGNSALPVTKKQLWSVLNKHDAGIRKHAYCSRCFAELGFIRLLPNPVVCACGWSKPKGKVKYFITLNIRAQLERLLTLPGVWEKLQYPRQREKESPDSIEDILDGEAYQHLRAAENGPSPADLTYTFNLDGFKLSDSSKTEAWPIFIKVNEFPPNLRQKHVILGGLWVDKDYVHFNLFMKTFVRQANKLSTTGLTWQLNGEEKVTRFFPTCCVADAKGRAGIMRMSTHTGNFGCTFCEHQGVKLEGSMKFPTPGTVVNRVRRHRGQEYVEEVVIQPAELRTDQNDLHPIYKGVTDFHTELLLEGIPDVYSVGVNERAVINHRLRRILTPTHITRKPREIDLRHMWKGSEWRNWLLFYGVPCMIDIVPNRYLRHFGLLSKAIFLLTRDVITEETLQIADRTLNEYVNLFQEVYGPQNMRFNVHILTHLVQCVRNWGPLWAHSTFPFESWNGRLAKKMSSPKGAIDQIVMRYLMHSLISSIPGNEQISDNVKEIIELQIIGSSMKDTVVVDNAYFFGQAVHRDATAVEVALLEESGYGNYNNLIEFTQVKVRGLECRSSRYRQDIESHNCFIYTKDDYFAVVDSIVILSDGVNQIGGVFLTVFEVGDAVLGVDHLVPIVNSDEKAFEVINNVKNVAIKGKIRDLWYISPMHNQCEID
ncbi:Halomucin [Frankliniella fusca]|uniref:Halomucin n=2 Tax=Frankliniella fusca TaxID=407009 RepID=A0AAE1LFX8_9NEOP|nr:Halomucin [Frankliniella fusca]